MFDCLVVIVYQAKGSRQKAVVHGLNTCYLILASITDVLAPVQTASGGFFRLFLEMLIYVGSWLLRPISLFFCPCSLTKDFRATPL
jgi:hypothetical protein